MTNAALSGETICFTPSGGDPFQSGPLMRWSPARVPVVRRPT